MPPTPTQRKNRDGAKMIVRDLIAGRVMAPSVTREGSVFWFMVPPAKATAKPIRRGSIQYALRHGWIEWLEPGGYALTDAGIEGVQKSDGIVARFRALKAKDKPPKEVSDTHGE